MPEVKRQTAYKCSIKMILEGNYVQMPGWDPNYITIKGLQVSRINVLAVTVNRECNTLTMDDGTGQIQIICFNDADKEKISKINVGDVLQIIGRPREYNSKRFIVPEILKVVEDRRWIDYRKCELSIQEKELPDKPEPVQKQQTAHQPSSAPQEISAVSDEEKSMEEELLNEQFENEHRYEDNYAFKIISAIRKLDKGDGANINDVIKQSGLEKADKYITSLINEGEIFEIRTGRIKILE